MRNEKPLQPAPDPDPKTGLAPWRSEILASHLASLPCGVRTSSSSRIRTPSCGFLALRSSRTGVLSRKGTLSNGAPSATYRLSSCVNVCELNFCCSRSLVKLMQSCSNEFFSKISKPKMSSTPIATPRSPPTAALIRLTSSSNIAE